MSLRPFSETADRVDQALRVAKRQPKSALARWAKRALIWVQYNGARRYFLKNPSHIAVCWNGQTGTRRAFMTGASDAGVATLFAELAPFPGRITLDPVGVNAENGLSRDPAFYTGWSASQADLNIDGWRKLGDNLTARASRRSDVGQGNANGLLQAGPFLFVPLQVPNDSQITAFGGWTKTIPGMIAALDVAAQNLPKGWHLRIKEHPSAKTPMTEALAATSDRIVVDNQTDTFAQVAASRGVITVNSSVGLQAFFYDKPVIVLGQAFFAIPGLVNVAHSADALNDALAGADSLTFDADLRASFMNYLDQAYYPRTNPGENGALVVNSEDIQAKLAQARGK